jgi:endonuclease/exonuclease/phosphatase family metal-dependent hydrolase
MQKAFTVVFGNITGGFVWAGKGHNEFVFSRVSVKEYIEHFQKYQPDILSLSEVHLEDKQGNSEMVQQISRALDLPYYACFAQSPSSLDTNKLAGLAILSRFPITSQEIFLLPNPRLEYDRPDGAHWVMFDKGAQKVSLDIEGNRLDVVNLHYFPFHHFGRKANEAEFADVRNELVKILLANETTSVIVTGDFNNKGLLLPVAMPELFADNLFHETVVAETTVIGLQEQFDHILYTPGTLQCLSSFVTTNLSDHYAVVASISYL